MTSVSDEYNHLCPNEAINKARNLWLSAEKESDLIKVENLYRYALKTSKREKKRRKKQREQGKTEDIDNEDIDEDIYFEDDDATEINEKEKMMNKKSKRKLESDTCLKTADCKKACEKLALLLCQSGRTKKAKALLSRLGYVCRLSSAVLDYNPQKDEEKNTHKTSNNDRPREIEVDPKGTEMPGRTDAPGLILDGFISKKEIQHLCSIFKSPTANYWIDHQYAVEPPSPYFSYILSLENTSQFGFVGTLVNKIFNSEKLRRKFPKLKNATKVEMWAHNRPHASGHQMHFDSDDEGKNGIRNPIMSTIIFITAGCGGPSLLTSQRLTDVQLARKGWLCYPKSERLVAFDGKYLHGVIPGKGVQSGRRVTLMFAFWSDICVREADGPGSARPFPLKDSNCEWAKELTLKKSPVNSSGGASDKDENSIEVDPLFIDRVYETLGGKRWSKSKGFPEYDAVFQGF